MKRRNPFGLAALVARARAARHSSTDYTGLRSDAGSALVELAVYLSLIGVPLLIAMDYYGPQIIDQIDIDNAAYAGAIYGMTSSTFADNTSGIQAAAQADSSIFGSNLTVTSSTVYVCSLTISGTQYTTEAAATTACTGTNNHVLQLVKVTASASVTPPLTVPGLAKTQTLSSTVVMEVEE